MSVRIDYVQLVVYVSWLSQKTKRIMKISTNKKGEEKDFRISNWVISFCCCFSYDLDREGEVGTFRSRMRMFW